MIGWRENTGKDRRTNTVDHLGITWRDARLGNSGLEEPPEGWVTEGGDDQRK